jgi:DNA-binding LytR/AlgR family response regulator
MLKIAICDDNTTFTGSLETAVMRESRDLAIQVETDVFFGGDTLLAAMREGQRYGIIFLDIEMENVDGIRAAHGIREMDRSVLLIYVSGYDQYLRELFEVEPFRFLSKPLDTGRFRRYFREACQRIGETEVYFQFTFNRRMRKLALKDIVYFESRNRVVYIFLRDGGWEQFYGKLNDVEESLLESRSYFLRIHQSFLVNYDYIRNMNFSGILLCFGGKEMELKISEDRQKSVRQRLCEIAGGKTVIE